MTAFLNLISQVSHVAHGPLLSNINLYMIYYYHLSLWRSVLYSDGYLGKELYTVILFIKSNDMKTHCLLNKLQKLFFSYLFTIRKYSSEKTDSPASLVTWISMNFFNKTWTFNLIDTGQKCSILFHYGVASRLMHEWKLTKKDKWIYQVFL